MSNKKVLIGIIIAALIVVAGIVTFGIVCRYKLLHSNNISKTQVVGKLKVSDGNIINDDGLYTYSVNVKNPTKKTISAKSLKFTFYDKDNKKLTILLGYINSEIEPDHSMTVMASTDVNLKKANRVKIELKK